VALAVTVEGRREILGLWAGDGGEGAKHRLHSSPSTRPRPRKPSWSGSPGLLPARSPFDAGAWGGSVRAQAACW
jgi:hypothetical protein